MTEAFTYIDIFATKGMEYILVLFFLAVFILFVYLTFKPKRTIRDMASRIHSAVSQWFRVPEYFYYHQGHTWVLPEGERVAKVGIDDFAQKLVGRIEHIEIPKRGQKILQGEKIWKLKVEGKEIAMLSPVDGEVVDINEEVFRNPEKILEDPYGKGWILMVYSPNLKVNLKNLITGRLARSWIEMLKDELFSRINYNLGFLLQDGGIPVSGMAKGLDPEKWDEIAKEFFLTKGM